MGKKHARENRPPAKQKTPRQIQSYVEDETGAHTWANFMAMACFGKDSVLMSSADDTKAFASEGSSISLTYKDASLRRRVKTGYIGEDLKANTWYKLDAQGEFVETDAS